MTFVYLRYRLYPNREQRTYFAKVFGCVRFVYNKMLEDSSNYYEETGERLRTNPHSYKEEYPFLREADSSALSNAKINLDKAFNHFFKGISQYPTFKSKKDNNFSYTTNFLSNNIRIEGSYLRLPKVKLVKIRLHRPVEGAIRSVTVTKNPSGQYHASILVDREIEKLPETEKEIGLDMGVLNLLTDSDGNKVQNPKISDKYAKRLAKEQRKLARKEKDSKNREKQRVRLARVYRKISAVRDDFLHKLSRRIVDENQVIVSEDLVIEDIIKDNDFTYDIADACWSKLIGMIEYKSEWYGRTFLKVGKFFPSSQMCSGCWHKNTGIKNISVKRWVCSECGAEHDRDINAAKNILYEGKRMLSIREENEALGLVRPEVTPMEIFTMWIDEVGNHDVVVHSQTC